MNPLAMILKMLKVNITPEQIAQLEAIIPQIPGRAVEIIQYVNNTANDLTLRMGNLERNQVINRSILLGIADGVEKLVSELSGEGTRPAGVGSTQRLLENGELNKLPGSLAEADNPIHRHGEIEG